MRAAGVPVGDDLRVLAGGPDEDVLVLADGATGVAIKAERGRETSTSGGLAVAASLPEVFQQPLLARPVTVGDRTVTAWVLGRPLDPALAEPAPWTDAAVLLARLHREPVPFLPCPDLPGQGFPASVADALRRLEATGGPRLTAAGVDPDVRDVVAAAAATLPAWAVDPAAPARPGRPATLVHGDFHLGQLVHGPVGWRLVDVGALGIGDPAWDLARPAMWLSAGLLGTLDWGDFLAAYLGAGGPAVEPGDPWTALEPVARAAAVQAAASALARAARTGVGLDEAGLAFLRTCARIAGQDQPVVAWEAP